MPFLNEFPSAICDWGFHFAVQEDNKQMNWVGTILVLFLSFQDIFPGKLFLVETKDNKTSR